MLMVPRCAFCGVECVLYGDGPARRGPARPGLRCAFCVGAKPVMCYCCEGRHVLHHIQSVYRAVQAANNESLRYLLEMAPIVADRRYQSERAQVIKEAVSRYIELAMTIKEAHCQKLVSNLAVISDVKRSYTLMEQRARDAADHDLNLAERHAGQPRPASELVGLTRRRVAGQLIPVEAEFGPRGVFFPSHPTVGPRGIHC